MKFRILLFLVFALVLPTFVQAAAWDLRMIQYNAANKPVSVDISPAANSLLGFSSTKQLVNITAGDNITISGNVISATGGGGGDITAATVNGYFADPSTNGSFSASAWRSDLGYAAVAASGSASDLSTGTLPDARFPATLPAASGVNLTALNASNLSSGTLPAARLPALTGDITTSAGSSATTLATVNSNVGTFGSATVVPVVTVNAKGQVTAISNTTITAGTGNVTNSGALASGNIIVGGGATVVSASNVTVSGNDVTVPGNLTVSGTQTIATANVTTANITAISGATANGQLYIGNATTGNFTKGNITSANGNATVSYSGGNIVINVTSGGGSSIPDRGFLPWPAGNVTLPTGFLEADGTEGTDDASADNTAAIIYLQKASGIAPTVASANLAVDGTTLNINMSESVTGTGTSGGGFTLSASGGAVTLGSVSGSGTGALTATANRTIIDTETLTLGYAPGDWVDGIGLPIASFSGASVTNGSTQSGGGGSLDPDDLGGLLNWYKTPIAGGTDGVATSWPDTQAANSLSASTQPLYQTNELNGYAVMEFDGSSRELTSGGSSANSYPRTIIAVIKVTSLAGHRTIVGSHLNSGLQLRVDTAGTLTLNKQGVANIGTSSGTVSADAWAVVACKVTSTTYAFWINGVAAGSGSHSETLSGGGTHTIGVAQGAEWFQGQIPEVVISSNAESDADIVSVMAGLATKYGL